MSNKSWHNKYDDDVSAMWKDHRKAQQDRRAARLPVRSDDIRRVETAGYAVRELTPYQFRIDGRLDLYPIHKRWHDIKTNRRGSYRSETALAVAVRILGAKSSDHA